MYHSRDDGVESACMKLGNSWLVCGSVGVFGAQFFLPLLMVVAVLPENTITLITTLELAVFAGLHFTNAITDCDSGI